MVRKCEGKRPLRRPTPTCEDNIKGNARRKMGVDRSDVVNVKISGSFCERGNELTVFIKYGEFVDLIIKFDILKKNSSPWSWLVR